MKRLSLVQAISTLDDHPDHLAYIKGRMHQRLVTEARRQGLSVGNLQWSEHFLPINDEDETGPVLKVLELTMDVLK